MLIRNAIADDILESVTRLGLMEIHVLDESGEFVRLTDERVLYDELLTHLVNEIRAKGYQITDGSFDREPLENLFVEDAPETECDQLANGCTCEECTRQVIDAIGCSPIDLDTHDFEDDCERIDQ